MRNASAALAAVVTLAVVRADAATSSGPSAAMSQDSSSRTSQLLDSGTATLTVLTVENSGDPTPAEWRMLEAIARGGGAGGRAGNAQRLAVRAFGRLERREAVPILLEFLSDATLSGEAATALMRVLRAHLPAAPDDPLLLGALDAVRQQTQSPVVLGHLPYTSPAQVEEAETQLRRWLENFTPPRSADARGLEALARRNRTLWSLTEDTRAALRKLAMREDPRLLSTDGATPRNAMAALMAAGAVDGELLSDVLGDRVPDVRRLAALALFSGGTSIEPDRRTALIRDALNDASALVRYDAVRAWARRETVSHGCEPLLLAMRDQSPHVALAAIDALAERCAASDDVTDAVAAEARTPSTVGEWQREPHALVALAKRSPERAALAMSTFRQHQVWQVRLYAARAAAALKDAGTLERLAYDENDNVREAALPALRVLRGSASDAAFIAALGRRDHQLLRTAAMALKDATPSRELVAALTSALERLTAEMKDSSRDTRLALIERIQTLGTREQSSVFERLLRDFDPRIAAAAARACSALTGKVVAPDPRVRPRPPGPAALEMSERLAARVELDTGRSFSILFDKAQAPLAYSRFARLVRARYYDGLTFHRVVGNFVVQGGGPGDNEYAGETSFWRDELGGANVRGTVGISTRGRHTGDGQFYINLVDNPSLDFEYSVFGRVRAEDLAVVDTIGEGTKILRINLVSSR